MTRLSKALTIALPLLAAGPALAASTARLTQSGYSQTAGSDPVTSFTSSYDTFAQSATRTREDFNRASQNYLTQLQSAKQLSSQLGARIEQAQDKRAALDTRTNLFVAQVSKDPKALDNIKALQEDRAKTDREIQALYAEARTYRDQLLVADKAADRIKDSMIQNAKTAYGPDADLSKVDFSKPQDVKAAFEKLDQKARTESINRITDQFLDSVKDDYSKAKLLLTDIDTLKQKFGDNQELFKNMQDKVQGRIDQTLLGQYVDKKVCDYFANPSKAAQCIPSNVEQKPATVGEQTQSAASAASDNKAAPVTPTSAPAPAAKAAAASSAGSARR